MSDLKPCPFCGGEAKLMLDKCSGVYFIGCSNYKCLGFGAICLSYETTEEAIAAWNRRAIDRDELLLIADDLDDCWESFRGQTIACGDIDNYEQKMAALIRKAVGA